MTAVVVAGIAILLLPALAVLIDGLAGIISRDRKYIFSNAACREFRVLVPIWGDIQYLTNVSVLAQYGSRVTLCTTGSESQVFYEALRNIAAEHSLRIFVDEPPPTRHAEAGGGRQARSTGGTTRDRLIRNVLPTVSEPYVIPLDADSIPGQDFEVLVGELAHRKLDLASVRIVPANPSETILSRLQALEYRVMMKIKFIAPWMLSGACHAARTDVLRDVMARHSLFFQGNDVEAGLIAQSLGYRVGFIPFDVLSDVPTRFGPWLRQRLAWAGGQFRLFIINIRFAPAHPLIWIYGAGITYLAIVLRWQSFERLTWPVLTVAIGYLALILYLHLRHGSGKWYALAMPVYALFSSFILTPLGVIWYAKMALASGNFGIIRPNREPWQRDVDGVKAPNREI